MAPRARSSRRGLYVAGGVVVAVVAVALVGGWWFLLRDAAAPPPTIDCGEAGRGEPAALDGSWVVVPGEEVFGGYRIDEVFASETFKRTVTGRSGEVSGELTIEDGRLQAVAVEVETGALTTDQARRDRWLENQALETAAFPTASFELTEPVLLPTDVAAGEGVAVDAVGDLTLHGVTREVVIPIEACYDPPGVDVAGSVGIDLADYDIEPPDVPGLAKADPKGALELQLRFERAE